MYKKILIATDGSTVSNLTACAGVAFAEQMQADILAVYVAPEYQYPVYIEIIPPSYPSEEEYRQAGPGSDGPDGLFRQSGPENRGSGAIAALRPDLHGLAWPQRLGAIAARQRDQQGAVALEIAGARA
jgi:nucleotide-binding universal stress UspA family protein